MTTSQDKFYEMLASKVFGVEHALSMYATDYVHMPAWGIYEKETIDEIQGIIDLCHIYLIGFSPKISLSDARKDGDNLIVSLGYLGKTHQLCYPLEDDMEVCQEDGLYFVRDSVGNRYFPNAEHMFCRLNAETTEIVFDVQYIGQALGSGGQRNALDRLLKHEMNRPGFPGGSDL